MDQTPFIHDDGTTYECKGAKDVTCRSVPSGWDKRQATVHLTICAYGKRRLKAAIIFRGLGKRISISEKKAWDTRVNGYFQNNAWCNEDIMRRWICEH